MKATAVLSLLLLFVLSACDNTPKSQTSSNAGKPTVSKETMQKMMEAREKALSPVREADNRVGEVIGLVMTKVEEDCDNISNIGELRNALVDMMMARNEVTDRIQMFNDHMVHALADGSGTESMMMEVENLERDMRDGRYHRAMRALYEQLRVAGVEHPAINEYLDAADNGEDGDHGPGAEDVNPQQHETPKVPAPSKDGGPVKVDAPNAH